jgi:hypothetical protein
VRGFPNWRERVSHVWVNRARADPAADLAGCEHCPDASCFDHALVPMVWNQNLAHAARFHAANLTLSGGAMRHDSPCTLVSNIGDLYPDSCDGAPACACVGGEVGCNPACDNFSGRLSRFGVSGWTRAENIAGNGDPVTIFYNWLWEPTSDGTCQWTQRNGHRWNILGEGLGQIGVGADGRFTVQDFAAGSPTHSIPAAVHYPRSGASIEFRANWYDPGRPPRTAFVNLDGMCHPLTVERGTGDHGTYLASVSLGAGCKHYYFLFQDAGDQAVTYPDTGSFGIDCDAGWSEERPAAGPTCGCEPQCAGAQCGDDGCGGSCGECSPPEVCNQGQCQSDCAQELTPCNSDCVDLASDPGHCGDCDRACAPGEECRESTCLSSGQDGGNGGGSDTGCGCGASGSLPQGAFLAVLVTCLRRRRSARFL